MLKGLDYRLVDIATDAVVTSFFKPVDGPDSPASSEKIATEPEIEVDPEFLKKSLRQLESPLNNGLKTNM